MKTRRRGGIKAEIKFKLYSELRIHVRLCLSRKMWLMSPSAALGSSPQVELPFVVVAPQSFRDVLQPFEWEQKDICRCWLKYLKWDSNKSWHILFKRVSGWHWLSTLLRAATLCASWASISGNVSALCRVCWSFCFASSRRSCSCLFFSSLWTVKKALIRHRNVRDFCCQHNWVLACLSQTLPVCAGTPCSPAHFPACLWYHGEKSPPSGRWGTCNTKPPSKRNAAGVLNTITWHISMFVTVSNELVPKQH